ncbi:hypothetical protein [Prosthecobacter sp.]|uniref:hypothetical protein n=1 Tax=Prosthecobacter sp. TaxID=1965333 RepID=UPI003783A4EF
MKMNLALPLLLGVCLPLLAEDPLPLDQYWPTKKFVPNHARVTLRLPESVILGQEVPAALVVHNDGKEPFEITPGGDYRSTGYPQRMKVRVHDAAGKMLTELPREAYGFGGGGISVPYTIAPGASREVDFPLDCYVSFQQAGEYTVTAGHDLGWKLDPLHPHPIAKATVKVVLPTEDEAKRYIDAAFARQPAVPPSDTSDALKLQMELDKTLCVLRHPLYLPLLIPHARAGSKSAMKGIGHMTTQEATQALLDLLDHASADVVETSAVQILRRLPSLEDGSKPAQGFYWGSEYQIDPLLPASWDARFEKPLLQSSLKLLWHDSVSVVRTAAQILQTRARPEHAPQVLDVLEQSFSRQYPLPAGWKPNSLDLPGPQGLLLEILDGMRKRGWRLENGNGGTAHQVAWLRQLADKEVPKPKGEKWKNSMLDSVEHGQPALKICSLQAIPQPLNDAAAKMVLKALDDDDLRVLRIACKVAGESKRAEFARPLAQIVELEHESFLQREAHHAALLCGGGLPLWQAWAAAIPDKECMHTAISALIRGTISLPASSGSSGNSNFTREQRFAIRAAWLAFLQQHQKQFAAGEKISPPDAETSARLTGADIHPTMPAARINLKDGSEWPPRPGKAKKRK